MGLRISQSSPDLQESAVQTVLEQAELQALQEAARDAPSTSGWGLAALVAGMLVVLVVALGLTSGSRGGARP